MPSSLEFNYYLFCHEHHILMRSHDPGRFLGTIVPNLKSNWLNVVIFRFLFVNLRHIPYIFVEVLGNLNRFICNQQLGRPRSLVLTPSYQHFVFPYFKFNFISLVQNWFSLFILFLKNLEANESSSLHCHKIQGLFRNFLCLVVSLIVWFLYKTLDYTIKCHSWMHRSAMICSVHIPTWIPRDIWGGGG